MHLKLHSLLLLGALLPVAASHAQTAIALQEMSNISDAEQRFYLDYGYFTTIENLDDILATTDTPNYQAINNGGGALVVTPASGRVQRLTLYAPAFGGGPPYLTPKPVALREGAGGDYDEGTPLDQWGNPYYFYSPLGLLEPKQDRTSQRYYGDHFDYYTIVSFGPDGIQSADDLAWEIPVTITTPAISSAHISTLTTKGAAPGYELVVRGYQFGASQGSGAILFDGSPAPATVTSWMDSRIEATLTSIPASDTLVSIRTAGGSTTSQVEWQNDLPPLAAVDWQMFQ